MGIKNILLTQKSVYLPSFKGITLMSALAEKLGKRFPRGHTFMYSQSTY